MENKENDEKDFYFEDDLLLNEEGKISYNENKTTKEDFKQEKTKLLIDEIINNSMFSKYQIYLVISLIFIFISEAIETCLFGVAIIPIRNKFNLSQGLLELASSSIFLGLCLGSALGGLMSKKIGRVLTINLSIGIVAIFHLLMSFVLITPVFIICRILIGIGVGMIVIISLNLFGEYQTSKYRFFLLMFIRSFSSVGQVIENLLALLIMPELQIEKFKKFLLVLSIFPLVAFILCIFFIYDSPRNLILSCNNEEKSLKKAFEILASIRGCDLTEEEKIQVIDEVKEAEANKEVKGKIWEIFNKKYRKSTILLIIIFFIIAAAGYYGNLFFSSLVMEQLRDKNKRKKKRTV